MERLRKEVTEGDRKAVPVRACEHNLLFVWG